MLSTIAFVFLFVAIVAATAGFFLRARRREEAGAGASTSDGLVEMRALGQRIETLVGQQQLQGETSRQHLSQKLDAVGEHVEQHRTHLAGLQNELRHEVHRRDAEMDEIRAQLVSIQHATVARALAPAATATAAPPLALAARAEAAPAPMASASPPPFPAVPMGDGLAAAFGDSPTADGWDTGAAAGRPADAEAPAGLFTFDDPFASASFDTADPFDDEPVTASGSEFEPFDFTTLDAEDDLLPLGSPDAPAFSFDDGAGLFEDLSFGGPTGALFGSPSAAGPPAEAATAFATVAPTAAAPAPPSESAWIARAGRPGTDGLVRMDEPLAPAFATVSFETPAFETPSFQVPAFEVPVSQPPAFEVPAFEVPALDVPALDVPAPAEAAAAAPQPSPESSTPVVPAGADDLTVIATIDADVQNALYLAGVTSLDEIARWSRADARRIAAGVSVSEEVIVNQWIFEAQAALFQSHTSR